MALSILPTFTVDAGAPPQAATLPTVVVQPDAALSCPVDTANAPASLADRVRAIPGLSWRDRGNAAQDVQVQSRGFGARSTFGIRGLRLFLDDVPLSANDGQSSAAAIPEQAPLALTFLRAPESLRYGQASGGVLLAESPAIESGRSQSVRFTGDADQMRLDGHVSLRGPDDHPGMRVAASHVDSDGARPHSAYRRSILHLVVDAPEDTAWNWRATVNLLDQPEAEDPLGVTAADWRAGLDGDPVAERFDTRKAVRSAHAGFSVAGDSDLGNWRQAAWIGARQVDQFLAIPIAVQANPRHPGGVIDLGRDTAGWLGTLAFAEGWTLGAEWGLTREGRRGYENFSEGEVGVRGRLRRDETNRLGTFDTFLLHERALTPAWSFDAGLRHGDWRLRSTDRFPANGDDSGRKALSLWSASGRFRYDGGGRWQHALSAGFGREAPTLNELAYRADGSAGIATGLTAARSTIVDWRQAWVFDGIRPELSLWQADGRDELVPATNAGGRASFQNAGRTRRRGIEASLHWDPVAGHHVDLVAMVLDARFTEGFSFRVGTEPVPRVVPAGNRIPGIARTQAQLAWSAQWTPRTSTRVTADVFGETPADDRNTVLAAGYASVDVAWRHQLAQDLEVSVGVRNLLDRRAIGSVIVNEANGRFFEPMVGRRVWLGLIWSP